jgi:hypothetical protein
MAARAYRAQVNGAFRLEEEPRVYRAREGQASEVVYPRKRLSLATTGRRSRASVLSYPAGCKQWRAIAARPIVGA